MKKSDKECANLCESEQPVGDGGVGVNVGAEGRGTVNMGGSAGAGLQAGLCGMKWIEEFSFGERRGEWTPQLLLNKFTKYLQLVNDCPLPREVKLSSKVGGKSGNVDEDTHRTVGRPYVIKSMCALLGIPDWDRFKAKYCNEATEDGMAFTDLCAQIENFMHGSLQEGAVAGIYSSKMVMGLTDVAEHVKQEVSGNFAEKSTEELAAEIQRLNQLGLTDDYSEHEQRDRGGSGRNEVRGFKGHGVSE